MQPETASGPLVAALEPEGLIRAGVPTRLHGAADEAAYIAALQPQRVHIATGFAASEDEVRSPETSRADIVHFATHGLIDLDVPALSAILLSLVDATGRPQDGHLRLHDILELRLSARLRDALQAKNPPA